MSALDTAGVAADTGGRSPDASIGGRDERERLALRVLGPDDEVLPADVLAAVLRRASHAVDDLCGVELEEIEPSAIVVLAEGLEQLRRQLDAVGAEVARHVDRSRPFSGEGFFSGRAWLKHRLQLSGDEAHARLQASRFTERVAVWGAAARAGQVGVAQTRLMARIAANPRIPQAALDRDRFELLDDAMSLPYREFERRARRWESLVDVSGAEAAAEQQRARRNVRLRPRPGGPGSGWNLTGTLDDVAGAEFEEILAHFVDAEWRADWDEARTRLGHAATTDDLRRTEPQRRADALLEMARAAASGRGRSRSACPTLNVLIDEKSFEADLRGERVDASRYRDVVCRTQSGRELHPDDAVNVGIWAHVRRVVYDSASVVIDLGRRSRLFEGPARDAVMLLDDECAWVGCDQPVDHCQADHSIAWAAHGATVPRNGTPLCGRHNRLKEAGYQVVRDADGQWHTFDPEGNEIF